MSAIYRLLIISLSTAILAVLSQLTIPIGITPITLQTFAVGLIASLLKWKEALLAVILYILLGALGLPVFSGGTSGIATLVSPNSGFIWGFLLFALVTSLLPKTNILSLFLANVFGDLCIFVCGLLSLHYLGQLSWEASFLAGFLPFIPVELIKILLISIIVPRLRQSLKTITYFQS
ncbi:biotin transporter BioY [Streptococcus sciuri]|uniref:Biotin transporter n=1 Tax=Streptococcus sciuri TaxID=2973939 RepID=A0ABT2F8H5_9STRE|nr:biotin transporter BioY [Streptococcus sciuri]MCS4488719.1 biotin transporter BioY [Streptococcus sciuri]